MAQTRDLYEILGVPKTASQDEIRKAYLKLAHKFHPDKTGGDKAAEEKLKEVNSAYDVLKNAEKRAQYDRFGSADGQPFGGGFTGQGFGGQGFDAPFEDFFDMLFGQGTRRRSPGGQPGNDLELRLSISLKEAALGTKKTVRFGRMDNCAECKGTGAAAGSRPEACPQCGGTGQVRAAHGFFSVTRACPQCHGSGRHIAKPCRSCSGQGQVKTSRELAVDVPAGVDTGSRLRVSGEGEAGAGGGPRGDLYIYIEVEPHPFLKRDGSILYCEIPITIAQAALGGSVRVPTLEGHADLNVPPGTQSGAQLRLRGLGMPDLRGYHQGDLIVRVVVETPVKLSRRQRDLLKEFEDLSDRKTHPLHSQFKEQIERR